LPRKNDGKLLRRLAATAAAGVALVGMTPAPAGGAGHEVYTTYDTVVSAKATFHSYGDYYTLDDLLPDGEGVALQYKVKGGTTQTMHWGRGTEAGAARYEQYKEGRVIYFRACTQKGEHGKLRYCGDWEAATA
jgi:hypothetical protein